MSRAQERRTRRRRPGTWAQAFLWCLLASAAAAGAEQRLLADRSIVDPPEGWSETVLPEAPGGVGAVYGDPRGTAVFEVSSFASTEFVDVSELTSVVIAELEARADTAPCLLWGQRSTLSDLSFAVGGTAVRGYAVCSIVDGAPRVLLAYAVGDAYAASHDLLLSCLDSYAPTQAWYLQPGPVSQFALEPQRGGVTLRTVRVAGRPVSFAVDAAQIEVSQLVIEREARILAGYAEDPGRNEAWARYYRLVYRDCSARTADACAAVASAVRGSTDPAAAVLEWVQGFQYARPGTLSDLASPLSAMGYEAGDCDARALVLMLVLRHLGIEALLLVSSEYAHALAAVATDIDEAAGFTRRGIPYAFAETTKKVGLGWIAPEMADLSGWIAVELGRPPSR